MPQDHRSLCESRGCSLTKTTQTHMPRQIKVLTGTMHLFHTITSCHDCLRLLQRLLPYSRMWHLGSRHKRWPQGPSNKGSRWRCFSCLLSGPAEHSRQSQLERVIRVITVRLNLELDVPFRRDLGFSSLLFSYFISHTWSNLELRNRHSHYGNFPLASHLGVGGSNDGIMS